MYLCALDAPTIPAPSPVPVLLLIHGGARVLCPSCPNRGVAVRQRQVREKERSKGRIETRGEQGEMLCEEATEREELERRVGDGGRKICRWALLLPHSDSQTSAVHHRAQKSQGRSGCSLHHERTSRTVGCRRIGFTSKTAVYAHSQAYSLVYAPCPML